MKKQLSMVVVIVVLLTVAGLSNASAQSQPSMKMSANIPFTFNVGNQTLPAGEYTIQCLNPSSDRKVLQLRSIDGAASVMIATGSVIGQTRDNGRLVFNRYGSQYFFAQVWQPAESIGMQATKSRTEKHAARELAAHRSAKETVSVLAKH